MGWAKPLAAALADQWGFLARYLDDADDGRRSPRAVARERGLRLAMIASVLAPRLSPAWIPGQAMRCRWTAADVVQLVERYGLTGRYAAVRTVIGAGDAHSPLKYLATVLDQALTNPRARVPHHSPVRARYERDVLAADLAASAARTAALRDEREHQAAAAAVERTGPQTARAVARAAAVAARAGSRVTHDAARVAALRDELDALPQPPAAEPWSEPVAQPGAGLPDGWHRPPRPVRPPGTRPMDGSAEPI